MKAIAAILLACISLSAYSSQYNAIEIANNFQIPWGVEFVNEKQAIVNEKHGTVSLLDITSGKKQILFKIPDVDGHGQGGLLDVALAPNSNIKHPTLFFTYSKSTPKGTTVALATAKLQNNKLEGWKDVFVADAITTLVVTLVAVLLSLTIRFTSQLVIAVCVTMDKIFKLMLVLLFA